MKKYDKRTMVSALILTLSLSLSACGSAAKDPSSGAADSSTSESFVTESSAAGTDTETIAEEIVDTDELFEYLKYASGDMLSVADGDEFTFSYEYTEDASFEDFAGLYSFSVPETGHYTVTVSDIDTENNMTIFNAVLDEASNILLNLYNVDTENSNIVSRDTAMNGEMDLIAGETYYAAFLAIPADVSSSVSGSVDIKVRMKSEVSDAAELKTDSPLTETVDADDLRLAIFTPEEEGYYLFDAYIDSDTEATAVIYYIQQEDMTNVELGSGLCYLEAGTPYYVIYGAEDTDGSENKLVLTCTAIDSADAKAEDEIKISNSTIISYQAKKDGQYLVYSVSDDDIYGAAYNNDLTVIAENDNADGLFSDNEDDFAFLMTVEKGQQYWIVVENDDMAACTVHIEEYTR